jgi:hypothetical protein
MQRHWSLYLPAFALLPGLLVRLAASQEVRPLVELSRPNAVGSCDTGLKLPSCGPWPTNEAEEPVVVVNPIHPNNVVTAWNQGHNQDIIAAVSLDGITKLGSVFQSHLLLAQAGLSSARAIRGFRLRRTVTFMRSL